MPPYDYVATRREDVKPIDDPTGFRRGMKRYTRLNALLYKWSGGRLMNTAMGGFPICLVTLTGHKSGRQLEIPLMHVADGTDKLLVGSQGGLDRDPVWVRSLEANPEVVIRALGSRRRYRARRLDPDEKRAAWPTLVAAYPPYDEYQARTDRDIPVFRCEPID
jgi:deazaflavin-dependent oxidoreductase (nitroreductase family)